MTNSPRLFAPDLFSDPIPRFSEIDDAQAEAREITALLATRYKKRGGVPEKIMQSGSLEINSRNFRVITNRGQVLLKKLSPSVSQKATLENQQALVAWLKDQGVPVPTPIRADDGTYLCRSGDNECWMAMDFVEGHFFSGRRASVAEVGHAIGRLHKALKTAPRQWPIDRRYAHFSDNDRAAFREVLSATPAVLERFAKPDAQLLEQNREFLARVWQVVIEHQKDYVTSEAGLIHIDLHPHNLLLQDDRVAAFIDLDSLMTGPLNMMLGFSAYKLLRQVVQAEAREKASADCQAMVGDFLDSFYEELPEFRKFRNSVVLFAMAEVCRRIAIIFRLTLREQNTTWNHVLKVHLVGLREIEFLFGQNSD